MKYLAWNCSLVCLVVLMTSASSRAQETALAPYRKPTLIAHRGASAYAPEHTLPAYKLALEQGADFVEPDLQITKDGVLVCLHDVTLDRTTNVKTVFPDRGREVRGRKGWPVADFTLAEIKSLDAGSWFDPKFAGTKVATFQEMIDLVKGKAGIIPETKAPETYTQLGFKMEKLVMEVLRKNGLAESGADAKTPIIIQSFSSESLKLLKSEHRCTLPLVFLFSAGNDSTPEGLDKIKSFADGIAPNKSVVTQKPELVKLAHEKGMSVTIWTCGSKDPAKQDDLHAEMKKFLDLKVDAIFTDNPDRFPR